MSASESSYFLNASSIPLSRGSGTSEGWTFSDRQLSLARAGQFILLVMIVVVALISSNSLRDEQPGVGPQLVPAPTPETMVRPMSLAIYLVD